MPLLEILINQHPAIEVQEMANDLRIAVATHGAVWSHKMKDAAESLGKQRLLSEDDAAGKGLPTFGHLTTCPPSWIFQKFYFSKFAANFLQIQRKDKFIG